MVTIVIDLNVRVRGNETFSRFSDMSGGRVSVGDVVSVIEVESGVRGPAVVTALNHVAEIVYMAVDWNLLRLPTD